MGNVGSKPGEEGNSLYLKDAQRFSIAAVTITNPRNRVLLNVTPNAFPATRYTAKRDIGDDAVIEYVQDPETITSSTPPTYLLKLSNEEELTFNFTLVVRQTRVPQSSYDPNNGASQTSLNNAVDTFINGLTYAFAPSTKDLDYLVTKEFQANPNLHKNPNVDLVGDYSTSGHASIQFHWSWKWKPPKPLEDRGGGWRNSCSFVEYDQRAHRLNTLATFSFWMQNSQRHPGSPKLPSPLLDISVPPRLRVPSSQSIESRVSDSDGGDGKDLQNPHSPNLEPAPEYGLGLIPTTTSSTGAPVAAPKVDINCQRPGDDVSAVDDGPLFRATIKAMEQKTGNMRARWKKVLKRAESASEAQHIANDAFSDLIEAFREASSSNANAVQPAMEHYFDKIAKEILSYEKQNTNNIRKLIIEPIYKLYNIDIKQAEAKKKDFEDESKEYYAYVGRYLGQRQDSLKDKKRAETDSKYQTKRRNFELKRFDYSSFMQDLHGGRKDQEVLSQLTKYADAQSKGYLATAKKIEALVPQLEALSAEVKEADKEFQLQRMEREEKRRVLEKSTKTYVEPENTTSPQTQPTLSVNANTNRPPSGTDAWAAGRSNLINSGFKNTSNAPTTGSPPSSSTNGGNTSVQSTPTSPGNQLPPTSSPSQNKFKGIRDLEERDYISLAGDTLAGAHRKEGLLWALSRPGSHLDPKGLNKQAWHKFWIVLDQGKLSEYNNWKQKLDLHMDPIDLRMASVREARNQERRFCFEVITPNYTRVYQATSEEDLKTWISAINNALQSAVENVPEKISTDSLPGATRRDIASVLTGKHSTSLSGHRSASNTKSVSRHATVGDRPHYRAIEQYDDSSAKLLQQIRDADAGNKVCVDCGNENKVDWVSINLGIVMCIECSGIHRSLGTHISKVRSIMLDTNVFTQDIIEILLTIGNRVSNMVWEAKLDRSLKPTPTSTRDQRLKFITAKYADSAYVTPISATLSHYSTPDETLLASIKKNDIQNVLYGIALKANPSVTDRSRNTPAVYLALAAADPASPSAGASPATSPGPHPPRTPVRKPFAIAELLFQNGADLPTQPSPFPLSSAAKMYLEQKADQRAGKRPINGMSPARIGGLDGTDDRITALPMIVAGNGTTPREREKEREARLQKRVSAGGRLGRGPGGASAP
ncbi:ARF GTPase-like protein activator [Patellaria atrata CBS 101060]|uniref:ADP-ribosylation factor GTPase-activating protein n=1 Tax=Patellaria atrata CBS 101060 TaxID=1346257 RepID=A0A9P4SHY9_9PEZI|nr:ARF GTPase-like protein activator [Patellaria atrata CBS 101060]